MAVPTREASRRGLCPSPQPIGKAQHCPHAIPVGLRGKGIGQRRIPLQRRAIELEVAAPTIGRGEVKEPMELNGVEERAETFCWTKHWYPIMSLKLLEEAQEEGFESGLPQIQRQTILERDIALWKDGEGVWRAVEDRCPHRMAALSLGSVQEDGTLACRYHGWCFNGRGECTRIPQAASPFAEARACANSRSKVAAFPTKEAHGLLWVWPDDSPTSWVDCMMEEPAVGRVSEPNMNEWVVFDFPIDYMIWMENVFDPMHVDFVHNGTALTNDKFEPKNALPVTQFRQARESKANSGFHLSVGKFNKAGKSRLEMCFKPPSLLAQSLMVEGVLPVDVLQYFVPVRPGLLRIFFGSRAEKPTKINNGILGFFLPRALAAVALWFRELPLLLLPSYIRLSLRHLLGPSNIKNIANQDTSVLHSQDKQLARENWDWKRFFLPTLGDVGVAAFRRWADKFANGGPAWHRSAGKNAVEDLRHVDLFSRWEHHTQWCPTCRKSVKFLGGLEDLLPKLTWAFVAVAVGLIANTSRIAYLRVAFGALAAAAVTLLARFEVQKLRARFLTDIPSSGIPEVAHGWPS